MLVTWCFFLDFAEVPCVKPESSAAEVKLSKWSISHYSVSMYGRRRKS